MESNPVCWFEIYVEDMVRAKKFYESMLKITLEELNSIGVEMWAFPMNTEKTGCTGALAKMDGVSPGGGGTLLYFSCDDCAVAEQRAIKAGGTVQKGKFSIGQFGYISLICDTEGNMIGLHSLA